MEFDTDYLILSFVVSTMGLIYFNYGRRRRRATILVCGLILMIYPYFLDSVIWLCIIAAILLITPKFIKR